MPTENLSSRYPNEYIDNQLNSGYQLFVENKAIRQKIIDGIEKDNFDSSEFDPKKELLNLFKLLGSIQALYDSEENWINDLVDAEYKEHPIELIHLILFKAVYEYLWRIMKSADVVKDAEEIGVINTFLQQLQECDPKKETLITDIEKFLYKKLKEYGDVEASFFSLHDKFFYVCGIVLGVIAALACGLSTGGAIFVLLAGFSFPLGLVIPLSVLIFLAGTRANFQLFSQHIPQFFKKLWKTGGVTEFINQQGQRLQLSGKKKFLLLPAGFLSLSVGIAAAAIAYLEGTKMLAIICPMLLATCPHLTIAILSILAGALLIGLTIVMLRTFISVLQSQFSWQDFKNDIREKWQKLNFIKGLAYIFKVFVMAAALFGLGYLDLTGTSTLASLLGWAAADIITLAAILGDLPFTLMTALAWCNSLFKNNSNPNSNVPKDISYYVCRIVEFFALIINAFGNAALVFTDSSVSRIASIAAFMNSYASNRSQENESELIQKPTEKSLSSLKGIFFSLSPKMPQVPSEVSHVPKGINDQSQSNKDAPRGSLSFQ